jgi:uncharacterized protein
MSSKEKKQVKKIRLEHYPNEDKLADLTIHEWPIWTKEVSEFPYVYDEQEVCYFLEGEAEVTPEGGEPVEMGAGDLVTFPKGMKCKWKILKDIRKRYRLG